MDAFAVMAALYAAHEAWHKLTQSRIRKVREHARIAEARSMERMVRYSRVAHVPIPEAHE